MFCRLGLNEMRCCTNKLGFVFIAGGDNKILSFIIQHVRYKNVGCCKCSWLIVDEGCFTSSFIPSTFFGISLCFFKHEGIMFRVMNTCTPVGSVDVILIIKWE